MTRIYNLIISLYGLVSTYSMIRQRVQVVDDWLGLAQLTIQQHLSDCHGDGSIKGTNRGSFALQKSNKICMLSSISAD